MTYKQFLKGEQLNMNKIKIDSIKRSKMNFNSTQTIINNNLRSTSNGTSNNTTQNYEKDDDEVFEFKQ